MATTASVNTVTGYFNTILQRSGTEVSAAEINSYATALDSGALTADQIRNALIASDEGQDVQFVVRLYQSFFGRVPDQAGLNFQVDALRNGASVVDIANGFAAAPEFAARYGSNTVTDAFITSVYTQVLGRVPSGDELSFYKNSGFDTARIALAFSESPEFTQLTSTVTQNFLQASALGTQTFQGPLALGQTFTLTAESGTSGTAGFVSGIDKLTGTGFADTFNATVASSGSTLASGDSINGAGGIDTLNLTTNGTALPTGVTISNVEQINLQASGTTSVAATAFGAEARGFTVQNSTAAVTVTALTATQSIGIAGAVTDAEFDYNAAATAGKSDVVTLNVTGATATGTVKIGTGFETVNVVGTGSIATLDTGAATTLNLTTNKALTIGAVDTDITTINGSASTGDLNVTATAATAFNFAGGAGNDIIHLGTSLSSDDVLTGNGGIDTIAISTTDVSTLNNQVVQALNAATGFEVLQFEGASAKIDGNTFTNTAINTLRFDTGSGSVDILNGGSARTYEFNDSGAVNIGLKAGVSSVNVSLTGVSASDQANLTSLTVDPAGSTAVPTTINLASTGVLNTSGVFAAANTTGTITADAGSTIAVTGSADLTIGGLTNAGTINASAFTGKLIATGSANADTIIGGTGADTINASAGGDTYTGGAGVDTFKFTNVNQASSTTFTTITDFASGTDKLDLSSLTTGTAGTFNATKVDVSGAADFNAALDLAAAGNGATNGAVSYFQQGGNTYVVVDNGAGATFSTTTDAVIKLTGLVTLTATDVNAL